MDYKAEMFLRRRTQLGEFSGFQPCDSILVSADSLEEAIWLIEAEATARFQTSAIFINRVYHDEKVVYNTPWDELGPLPISFLG